MAEEKVLIDNTKAVDATETKTTFGLDSYNKSTPKWASNLFDLYFIISKALIGYIAATKLLPATTVVEITFFITLLLDPIVRGLTKMFGVTVPDEINK